ncbi:hypothetical protein PV08_04122 [Exophiala spinifera]|uniref:Uncharacterized protein n=1 Tax=Exophiala spinifera TaxID=91928 RepID=A0A0D1ZW69_9EURO|nr:uncharacterized protein PV08_04122 [Exophiala spinifera]KIW16932.1 hypothetical protein PV08_04122 [Exophiala spinifera]
MQFKKYIPDFLLPTDEPAAPPRIYDIPLSHKAQPGAEQAVDEHRRSSAGSSEQGQARRTSWHPGMIFGR